MLRPLIRPIVRPLVRGVTEPGYGSLAAQIRLLFAAGEQGAWYDPSSLSSLNTKSDGSGTVPALGNPVGRMLDKSGNGNNAIQATDTARPTVQARVNLLNNTAFDGAVSGTPGTGPTGWNRFNSGGTLTVSPDGEENQVRVEVTANRDQFSQTLAVAANTTYTYSVLCDTSGTTGINNLFVVSNPPAGTTLEYFVDDSSWPNPNTSPSAGLHRITVRASVGGTAGTAQIKWGAGTLGVMSGHGVFYDIQLEIGSTATTYQRVTTATDYADIGLPRKIDYDGVDDKLTTTFPDLGTNVTIARAIPGVGASILTGQTIGAGDWDDNTDHHGLLIIDRALTVPETALVTRWANLRAGV